MILIEPVTSWKEQAVSVEKAIREAMDTPVNPPSLKMSRTRDVSPYLPLREASAQRLRAQHAAAPRPYFASPQARQQLRGFQPPLIQPKPHIDAMTASSEHAFAARDARKPSKLPLDMNATYRQIAPHNVNTEWSRQQPDRTGDRSGPPSPFLLSPRLRSHGPVLRSAQSLGDGLRNSRRTPTTPSDSYFGDDSSTARSSVSRPSGKGEGARASYRSVVTTDSSLLNTSSYATTRSSQATGHSGSSFVNEDPDIDIDHEDGDMSVEDAIRMYEDGFESSHPSLEGSESSETPHKIDRPLSQSTADTKPQTTHRRSKSASLLTPWKSSAPPVLVEKAAAGPASKKPDQQSPSPAVPRDRYGFKKSSHHISVEAYDKWNAAYELHLRRRKLKWAALMSSYGLSIIEPIRFPPKNDKIKRYVRKGIPPELRGPAWFWYAGGPGKLAQNPGLYRNLLHQVEAGKLSDNDKEHIERDLNRTFPDNDRFKPDDVSDPEHGNTLKDPRRHSKDSEPPIVQALRRVLQAFAVDNPSIGYCQSLNFIAGLLLLFLKEDEEKAFTLLTIITSTHLPGTHGVALEGANIDIAVLMYCIRDTLPTIWTKLDDKGGLLGTESEAGPLRLPTVSLATTAWFMSLFVGTLPIESVLRVWDCLFFEGSKTLFRIALAIFKTGEREIISVSDPMEIFQVVQTIPRSMLDINGLMEMCFRRRGGFGHISQGIVEQRRQERRDMTQTELARLDDDQGRVWTRRWRTRTKA